MSRPASRSRSRMSSSSTRSILCPNTSLDGLVAAAGSLNPLARMHWATRCDVDLRHVLDVRAFDLRNALKLEPQLLDDLAHEHDADIGCVSIREPGAIDETRFTRWLNQLVQAQGKDLLRIKGIIDLEGEPRRFVFHGVHMTLDGRPGKPWKPGEPRVNELVFIGRTIGCGRAAIRIRSVPCNR